jgi:hypothetical protein
MDTENDFLRETIISETSELEIVTSSLDNEYSNSQMLQIKNMLQPIFIMNLPGSDITMILNPSRGNIKKKELAASGEPFYESINSSFSMINELPEIDNSSETLLPPIPVFCRIHNGRITFGLNLIAKTTVPLLDLKSLQLTYQFTLDPSGVPQINVYVFFLDDTSVNVPKYWNNVLNITLPAGSLPNVTPNLFKTVQIFLLSEDPKTSRGTVTTVQPTSN